jgi:hypothetical protein
MGQMKSTYEILVEKPKGKKTFERTRSRKDNIKMDLKT